MSLSKEECVPCRQGAPMLESSEIEKLIKEIPGWNVTMRDGISTIERVFQFEDFSQALAFTVRVGLLAEQQGHHPAILTEWGRVTVSFWTHKIKGLHHNDFVAAAKVDDLFRSIR
jgi:4a-hydroxytetrahydrobiopterin dehydratase